MIVVFDTNILVSSLISPSGNESIVFSLFLTQEIEAAVSSSILAEYNQVLLRRKFSFAASQTSEVLRLMATYALRVEPERTLTLSPDESDNRFLECADAASADFLITGNKRHFPARHGKTKIVSAREFLDALAG